MINKIDKTTGSITNNYYKVDVINGWRGFAILAVLIVHSISRIPFEPIHYKIFGMDISFQLSKILASGWFGVDAFFMASGFVIHLPYATERRKFLALNDVFSFFRRRIARLAPLCFITFFLTLVMFEPPSVTSTKFWSYIIHFPLSTFTLIKGINVLPGNGGVAWSITIEFIISFLFPIFFMISKKRGFLFLISITLCLCVIHRMLLVYQNPTLLSISGHHILCAFSADVIGISALEFCVGMAAAEYYQKRRGIAHWSSTLNALCFISGFVLVFTFFKLYFKNYSTNDIHAPRTFFDALCPLILVFGLSLSFLSVLFARQHSLIKKIFTIKCLQIIGLMCFSIYIWHAPFFTKLITNISPTLSGLATHISTIAAVLIFSAASYRFIEFPHKTVSELFLLKLKKEKFEKPDTTENLVIT